MVKKGLFIAIEGPDGAGKSTQVRSLIKHIEEKSKYIDVLRTHEPWRSSEIKRKLAEDKDSFSDGLAMAQLYVADRVNHTQELIVPLLNKGIFVISDRYAMSTCAYQWAQGVDVNKLLALHKGKGILIPDLTLVFDVPPGVAFQRRKERGGPADKFELDQTFTVKLVGKYKELVAMAGTPEGKLFGKHVVRIDARQSVEAVSAKIQKAFDMAYKEWQQRPL